MLTLLPWIQLLVLPALFLGGLWITSTEKCKTYIPAYLFGAYVGILSSLLIVIPLSVGRILEVTIVLALLVFVLSNAFRGILSTDDLNTHHSFKYKPTVDKLIKRTSSIAQNPSKKIVFAVGLALGFSSYITIPTRLQTSMPSLDVLALQLLYALLFTLITGVFSWLIYKIQLFLSTPEDEGSDSSLFRTTAVSSFLVIVLWVLFTLHVTMF